MTVGTLFVLAIAFMYRASGCYIDIDGTPIISTTKKENSSGNETAVHFLDVGQGDSILICGLEKNILIDGGERDQGDTVIAELKEYGVTEIDYMIATHPHSDHIGGLVDVLRYASDYDDIKVNNVIIPDIPEEDIPTSAVYGNFLNGAAENDLSVTFAEYGMTIDTGSGVMTLYPPVKDKNYSSLNDYSVCAYLDCGDISFFFTGDMEKQEEKDMLEAGYLDEMEATVLKAGHHGSETSSSQELLDRLSPEYVVVSCGTGNKYGHPHKEAMQRFKNCADKIYRTDVDGTVSCTTDGKTITWQTKGR